MIVYDLLSISNRLNTFKHSMLWFPIHISSMVHILTLFLMNKCVPKWVTISITLFGLQTELYINPHFTSLICDNVFTQHLTHMTYIYIYVYIYIKTTVKKVL